MRRRDRRNKRQVTVVVTSAICTLVLMTVGYAAFSTNLNITAKGNVVKNPLQGPVSEVITNLVESNSEQVYTDDNNNIRYYGKDPNNYVYFNCTDINNQTSDTCELWRIMGIIDGKVKLIRNETLTPVTTDTQNGSSVTIGESDGFYWNSVLQSGDNYNNWVGSTLQIYLNGTYYNNIDDIYQKMISEEKYYLGGAGYNYTDLTASGYYDIERGNTVYSGNPTNTTQKIGLMYPSDYGYAAGSGCLSTNLFDYGISGNNCPNSDYLFSGVNEWLQNPYTNRCYSPYIAVNGYVAGYVHGLASYACDDSRDGDTYAIRPVLYLTSQTKITGGKGTAISPFTLG